MLRRLIRDPLVLFVGIGVAAYLLYAAFVDIDEPDDSERVIRISRGTVDWLKTTWESRIKRPPTDEEWNGLLESHIRETVLYREALAMGLDADDTIVRRRLAQKLEFLTLDLVQPAAPSEAELQAYMQSNRAPFEIPARVTITHIYFSPDQRGAKTESAARATLAKLGRA